jgi:mannosyltransferase
MHFAGLVGRWRLADHGAGLAHSGSRSQSLLSILRRTFRMEPTSTVTRTAAVRAYERPTAFAAMLVALVSVGAILRLYRLNAQLWLDEISALTGYFRRPFMEILLDWSPTSHAFFDLLARLSILVLGESPVAIRLPAALFGVLGVMAFYLLATRLLDSRRAFFVAALFTVSYHHIYYSQNARGYTALIFLFLMATVLMVDFRATARISTAAGVGYVATILLAAYANVVGAVILPAHLLMVGALYVRRDPGREPPFPWRRYVRFAGPAAAGLVLLYVPFLRTMIAYIQFTAAESGSGPRPGAGLVLEVVEGLSAAFPHPFILAAAGLVGLVGFLILIRDRPFAAAALLLPLALQVALIFPLGVGIHPRYFAMALPVVYLVGGFGVVWLVDRAAGFVWSSERRRVEVAAMTMVVLASALPLRAYYAMPKQDFLGAIEVVDRLGQEGDARVGVHLAGNVLTRYYDVGFTSVHSVGELREQELGSARVWLVTTLERLLLADQPELHEYIRQNYRRVHVLPGSLGDGSMRIYERTH